MTLHLIKLAVGIEDVAHLRRIQARRLAEHGFVFHRTRMVPRRADELADGGSIYWVIRGLVQVRQCILGLRDAPDGEGRRACLIELAPELAETEARPQRAFQGWRYLDPAQAPADLGGAAALTDMPGEMAAELRRLGLL